LIKPFAPHYTQFPLAKALRNKHYPQKSDTHSDKSKTNSACASNEDFSRHPARVQRSFFAYAHLSAPISNSGNQVGLRHPEQLAKQLLSSHIFIIPFWLPDASILW